MTITDPDDLYKLLRDGQPHREVYRGQSGRWFVTYGGGEVACSAVEELVERELIHSVYSNCPRDGYHVGKTLDVGATNEERKKHRRRADAPLIYTDGSRECR